MRVAAMASCCVNVFNSLTYAPNRVCVPLGLAGAKLRFTKARMSSARDGDWSVGRPRWRAGEGASATTSCTAKAAPRPFSVVYNAKVAQASAAAYLRWAVLSQCREWRRL